MFRLVRRLLALGVLGALLGTAYVVVPMWTAWAIREAIRDNDSAYLEHKIEWDTVRASLKESLAEFTFSATGDLTPAPGQPSLWQRAKAYIGRGALDQFVETTVTPAGMAGLFTMRKAYRAGLGGTGEVRPPVLERIRRVWSRVTRAEFASLDRFEMDMIDKDAPERTICLELERRGFEWKMTGLRVKATAPAKVAPTNFLAM